MTNKKLLLFIGLIIVIFIIFFILFNINDFQNAINNIVNLGLTQKEGLIVDNFYIDDYKMVLNPLDNNKDQSIPLNFYMINDKEMARYPVQDNVATIIPKDEVIPNGYYIVTLTLNGKSEKRLAKVPDGFVASADKKSLIDNNVKYDSNNYNVEYHDDLNDKNAQKGIYDTKFGSMFVKSNEGTIIEVPYKENQVLPTYYEPGSFVYNASSYVPNYEDSILLTKTLGKDNLKPMGITTDITGGFCNQMKNDPTAMEQKCNKIPANQCSSTTCCVLMGGQKCVAGDKYGPNNRANFTDPYLINKDFYYYLGKCYGNCDKPFSIRNDIIINGEVDLDIEQNPFSSINGNIGGNIGGNISFH
jgi:hypothetical protein